MDKNINEIAKTMTVLPRFLHFLRGTFKPEVNKNIKKNEMKTLFAISNNPNKPMKYYVEIIDMENGSFTYLADKLVNKGLIRKEQAKEDKRITVLNLTKKGEEVTSSLKSNFEAHISKLLSTLSEDDLRDLSKSIELLDDILNKLQKG